MLTLPPLLLAAAIALQAPTTVVLGQVERDLTGDGKPEILRVLGVGPTMENLDVTFTIESAGKIVYQSKLERMTRSVGFDAGRRVISPAEHRVRIKEFGHWFFGKEKFQTAAEFVGSLTLEAPGRVAEIPDVIARDQLPSDKVSASVIWQEIQNSPVTIFTFSPGGDSLVAIGWNARAGRFYRLLECC